MKGLQTLIVSIAILFINCNTSITPQRTNDYNYFINAKVSNQGCDISIYNLRDLETSIISNAKVFIETNRDMQSVPFSGISYNLVKWIKPGSLYNLIIIINDDSTFYSSETPDSVENAVLGLNKLTEFDYSVTLRIDKLNTDPDFIYYAKNLFFNFNPSWQDDFIAPESTFSNVMHLDFQMPDFCTKPIMPQKFKSFEFYRVHKKYVDFLKYSEVINNNQGNPLFLSYKSPSDVVIDKNYFRIFEFTKIKTNEIGIQDSSFKLLNIYLYDKQGIPLDEEGQRKVKLSIVSEDLKSSLPDIDLNAKNPTQLSIRQLATLVNSSCTDITDINRLQNVFLDIYAYTSVESEQQKVYVTRLDSAIQVRLNIDL